MQYSELKELFLYLHSIPPDDTRDVLLELYERTSDRVEFNPEQAYLRVDSFTGAFALKVGGYNIVHMHHMPVLTAFQFVSCNIYGDATKCDGSELKAIISKHKRKNKIKDFLQNVK
jgi:hypothetical protein